MKEYYLFGQAARAYLDYNFERFLIEMDIDDIISMSFVFDPSVHTGEHLLAEYDGYTDWVKISESDYNGIVNHEPETPSRDDNYEDYNEVHGSTSKNRRS